MPRRKPLRELGVWANGSRVGTWRLPARGATEFEYESEWLEAPESRPLSLSLPLTLDRVPHRGAIVEAYFENLLPDSDAIRRRLQERFAAATRNAFDLLGAIGRDCIGAVQIQPADEPPSNVRTIDAQPLTESEIARELANVTSPAPRGVESDDFRISIAGAQEKTALLRQGTRWYRPVGSTPTTHIFKLPLGLVGGRQADMRTSVENEWLCSRLVAAFGLPVAAADMATYGDIKVLVVERFDRQLHSSGKYWLRLMQEDFAQATGTPWHRKYQSDGGPGVIDLARVLRGSVDADRDLDTLFAAQVLFHLLAAIDGHAKNFSLRILAGGSYRLTPLYDVLSAWPVIGKRANQIPLEKVKMAMAMPGERPRYLLQSVQRRHFELLGRKLGLGESTDQRLDTLLAKVPAVIDAVGSDLPREFSGQLAESIFAGMRRAADRLAS